MGDLVILVWRCRASPALWQSWLSSKIRSTSGVAGADLEIHGLDVSQLKHSDAGAGRGTRRL
jgi:hypothetical protein